MRYRLVGLGLFVLLPALTELPAAPVPQKYPRIFALYYVGCHRNDPVENKKRVEKAIEDVLNYKKPTYGWIA